MNFLALRGCSVAWFITLPWGVIRCNSYQSYETEMVATRVQNKSWIKG